MPSRGRRSAYSGAAGKMPALPGGLPIRECVISPRHAWERGLPARENRMCGVPPRRSTLLPFNRLRAACTGAAGKMPALPGGLPAREMGRAASRRANGYWSKKTVGWRMSASSPSSDAKSVSPSKSICARRFASVASGYSVAPDDVDASGEWLFLDAQCPLPL